MASVVFLSSSLESCCSASSSTSLWSLLLAACDLAATPSSPPRAREWGLLVLVKLAPARILASAPRCPAILSGSVSPWLMPRPRTVVPLPLLATVSPLSRRLFTPCQSSAEPLLALPTTSSRALLCLRSKLFVWISPISSREVVKRRPATWSGRQGEREREKWQIIKATFAFVSGDGTSEQRRWDHLTC